MVNYALYALAALGAAAVGRSTYGWLVPDRGAQSPAWLTAPDDGAGDELLDTLGAHLDSAVLDGNRVELLENGVEIFPAMLDAIEQAEASVSFLTYIYWTGEIAHRTADALARAARRGVDVRVLLDAYGAQKMNARLVRMLTDAGVEVAWFHPLRWYRLHQVNNRTHRKVLVVDGQVGFTGGVGIAAEWEGDARDSSEWRDDHFRVRGPAVRYLQGAFAEDWREATGEVLLGPRMFRPLEAEGPARVLPLVTSPGGRPSPIGFLYWLALRVARERVDIATPYFLPDDGLIESMGPAIERGVRVRLLVPGAHTDTPLLRAASFARYEMLLSQGVELYEFQPTMMHAKTVSIDGRWSIVGSANFDLRSFELNNEVVLVVDDPGLATCIDASFEADLERARRLDLDDVRAARLSKRIASRLAVTLRAHL